MVFAGRPQSFAAFEMFIIILTNITVYRCLDGKLTVKHPSDL
jgi:hypothetical protein